MNPLSKLMTPGIMPEHEWIKYLAPGIFIPCDKEGKVSEELEEFDWEVFYQAIIDSGTWEVGTTFDEKNNFTKDISSGTGENLNQALDFIGPLGLRALLVAKNHPDKARLTQLFKFHEFDAMPPPQIGVFFEHGTELAEAVQEEKDITVEIMANDVIRNSVSLGRFGSDCIISRSDFPVGLVPIAEEVETDPEQPPAPPFQELTGPPSVLHMVFTESSLIAEFFIKLWDKVWPKLISLNASKISIMYFKLKGIKHWDKLLGSQKALAWMKATLPGQPEGSPLGGIRENELLGVIGEEAREIGQDPGLSRWRQAMEAEGLTPKQREVAKKGYSRSLKAILDKRHERAQELGVAQETDLTPGQVIYVPGGATPTRHGILVSFNEVLVEVPPDMAGSTVRVRTPEGSTVSVVIPKDFGDGGMMAVRLSRLPKVGQETIEEFERGIGGGGDYTFARATGRGNFRATDWR